MSKHMLSIALLACAVVGGFSAEEKGEKDEATVTIDQVPAAVQTAIKSATTGATIKEIEKETKHGKTVYEVEFVGADGKKQEAKFDESGKQIVKGEEKHEHGDK